MLSITFKPPMLYYAECHYAECYYAECHYAECHYTEYRYAECHGAENIQKLILPRPSSMKKKSFIGLTPG
jgi:hypothetical protein